MISPKLVLMFGGLLLALSVFAYISHLRSEVSDLKAAIAQGALDAERNTRKAVEKARAEERTQLENIRTQNEHALIASQRETNAARKRLTALQRAIQEAADADPSVDVWRNTPIPESIRLLLSPGDPNGPGGGGAISLPPPPPGAVG